MTSVGHHTTNSEHRIRHPEMTLFGNVLSNMTETAQVPFLINQIFIPIDKKENNGQLYEMQQTGT